MGTTQIRAALLFLTVISGLPVNAVLAQNPFIDRPLFSPDRQPHADTPGPAALPGRELPAGTYRLSGLIRTNSQGTLVLLSGAEGSPAQRVRPGDSVNGWLILSATETGIRVTRRGVAQEITLRQAFPE
jgi:hypothetical protein